MRWRSYYLGVSRGYGQRRECMLSGIARTWLDPGDGDTSGGGDATCFLCREG
jgi:hypothetical protein